MTNLTTKGTTSYFETVSDRPEGAILNLQEIRDHEFHPAFVYEVAQSGYIRKYKLLETFHASKHVYIDDLSAEFLPAILVDSDSGDRYQCFFLAQSGINPNVDDGPLDKCGEFQTFFDEQLAETYSEYLKNNAEYIAGVEAYHRKCDDFNDYEDEYYEEE